MAVWAEQCPENFLNKWLLMEAESARLLGRFEEALALYDRSIAAARTHKFIQDEGLANELAARCLLEHSRPEAAAGYLKKAHYAYHLWGARGKVRDLERHHPQLLEARSWSDRPEEGTSLDRLDLSAILKASQAIAGEIVLDKLLKKLTRILVENAGAQRGVLILADEDRLLIEAEGWIDRENIPVLESRPLESASGISREIVHYVARTHEYLVLDNASENDLFSSDEALVSSPTKSIVCGPLLQKAKLVGLFYLENNLISGAFTPDRLEVLKHLAASMAISIENARLYSAREAQALELKDTNARLHQQIQERRRTEEKYRSIFENALEGIFQATPEGRFISANPALARLFGFEDPDAIIREIKDIGKELYVRPEQRDTLQALMLEQGAAVSGYEVRMYRKDGSTIWASIHARPVFDEQGRFIQVEGILTDITASKLEAQASREREQVLRRENRLLRSNIKDRYKFGNIIGKSEPMQEVYDLICKAAAAEANVIVYGESGTGKELVARAIHEMSDRREADFVSINCGAIPENLLESEFFGYKKGAFTGAFADKKGHLDQADQGTLFLDELGEISHSLQVKLLRVLEGHGFTPVGGSRVHRTDVRIIAATHRDLRAAVRNGTLREDFYYRIHIIPITIPPLRERKEDIPLLIEHFQNLFETKTRPQLIPAQVLDALRAYDWPGNVRELQNTLQRYFMLGKLDFMQQPGPVFQQARPPAAGPDGRGRLEPALQACEKAIISETLDRHLWRRGQTANALGINRKTLFLKMKEHGLQKPQNG